MVLKENSQINTCFVNFTEILLLVYLLFALLAFFCNTVETDFKGRKITIIQSLVFETYLFHVNHVVSPKFPISFCSIFLFTYFNYWNLWFWRFWRQNSSEGFTTYGLPRRCGGPTQETWDSDLMPGSEESLEEGMATHSNIAAWSISRTEEPGRLQSTGSQSQTRRKRLSTLTHSIYAPHTFLPEAGRSLGLSLQSDLISAYSLVAHLVKNLPAMQETWVRSLGWEDPLEKKVTHSSILAWRNPRTV